MILLTAPTTEPVTLAEAKLAARVSGSSMDLLIPGLITAARELAEQETGAKFMQQTWRTELVDWPAATDVLAINQATAAAVSYWNGAAWSSELAESAYCLAPDGIYLVLAPATAPAGRRLATDPWARACASISPPAPPIQMPWPSRSSCTSAACVACWIDNPQAASATGVALPMHLGHLLDRQRLYY